MSHYNFKKITVVPGGKVKSLSLYTCMKMYSAVCRKRCSLFVDVVRVLYNVNTWFK